MSQSNNDLLTMKDLAERLGVTYGRLRGFAEAEGVGAYVGAQDVPGVKGVRYPAEAEGLFRALIDASDRKLVTPRTAAAWLSTMRTDPANVPFEQSNNGALMRTSGGAIASLRQSDNDGLTSALEAIAQLLKSRIEPVEDALLTVDQVQEIVPVGAGWIRRNIPSVKVGRRRLWRRSEVLRYIERLGGDK